MKSSAILLFSLALAWPTTDVLASSTGPIARLAGIAGVKDGDGITFGAVEVRLQGIAAPELNQVMGQESLEALRTLAEGQQVECLLDGTTANRRPVGVCFVGKLDVGAAQVANGYARDCPHFSEGRYDAAENSAQAAGNDLSAVYVLPKYCK